MNEKKIIARWETKKGGNFIELFHDRFGYGYRGTYCGGCLGEIRDDQIAIEAIANTTIKCFKIDFPSVKRTW